jgi:hypothetical protein
MLLDTTLKENSVVTVEKGKWVAVLSYDNTSYDRIALAWLQDGTIYWDGGPGYCPFNEKTHEIVKWYDWSKSYPQDEVFYREYGPQPEIPTRQSAGWLARDGRWWTCEGWQHDEYARILSYMEYGEYHRQRQFEGRGWIKVYPEGLCSKPIKLIEGKDDFDYIYIPIVLTTNQLETLEKLVTLDPDSEYGKQMGQQITLWKEEL